MKKQFILFGFMALILSSLTVTVFAQAKKKTLSAKDKQAIIEIFRQLRAPYYLEFSGTEYYGKKDLLPTSLSQAIIENKSSGQTAGYFFRTHEEIGMWYAVSTGAGTTQTLEEVFGKTNATKLQAIINKNSGGQ